MPANQDYAPDLIVHAGEWPHGVCCGLCHRMMNDGDRYAEQLMGIIADIPVVMIVCYPCDELAGNDT